jgi:alpha-L-arabinofuranosidase
MKHLILPWLVLGFVSITAFGAMDTATQATATITVQAGQPGTPISPVLYGVFYEDINYAADGGLYAEMVQNRSFEYYPIKPSTRDVKELTDQQPLFAWSPVERGGLRAKLESAILAPLHPNNPTYLALTASGSTGEAGVANTGYDGGMPVKAGEIYDFSLYARSLGGETAPLTVALEAPDGTVLAFAEVPAPGATWAKQEATLNCTHDESKARLVLTAKAKGQFALDMISLFPRDTFKGRKNGLRCDLAQAIADLKPKTFRFPGGCIVHGTGLANAYRWKDTVGDVAHRRPNFNRWGYHQTYGLGYFEYFQFCEDIGAAPLPILPCGVSCGFNKPFQVANDDEVGDWIQEALDLIEFANGPAAGRWGRVRAEMGHPTPFGLKYLGLGNEEHDTTSFRALFPRFVKAIRDRHPEIQIVGTSGLGPGIPLFNLMQQCGADISDEHYYMAPEWFIENRNRFDNLKRGTPKVFVGEYASRGNTLFNAVAEAVYLTGIEHNADQVVMTAYAPLLARYDYTQWKAANLIWFDAQSVVLTPNYHVQRLFSTHVGDHYLPNTVAFAAAPAAGAAAPVLAASSSCIEKDGSFILMLANPMKEAVAARIVLEGVSSRLKGERILLTGARDAVNDLANPNRVAPVTTSLEVAPSFECDVPDMSVQVLRLKAF